MDSQRARLRAIAVAAMRERGLEPDFPADAVAQAASLRSAPRATEEAVRDLTALLWCSIDNDDSRDLDQLTAAQAAGDGATKVFVAIADVDAAARRGSPIDRHAAVNTTSVYTPAVIFPMLPEKLSTDLTSLADRQNRLAIIFEFTAAASGSIDGAAVYGAIVNNHAKLAYNAVDAWLGGRAAAPAAVAAVAGMDAQLALQDRAAQAIRGARDEHGALDLETIEAQAVFDGEMLRELRPELPN